MGDIEKKDVLKCYLGSKQKRIIFCLVTLLFFILIFFLNRVYPLCLDDWTYSFVTGDPSVRVSSISDIIRSQYNHYFQWGGRSVVHSIAQFLLMQNKWVIDLLNSLVYILYIFLIYRICNCLNRTNIILFLFINAAIWFFAPAYLFSTVWVVGSANYLWGATIRLLFIIPYCIYFISLSKETDIKCSWVKIILFFLGGIIAGWTNENTSAAMIFLLFSFLVYWKIRRCDIPLWAFFGVLGALIGFVLMVIAPGNYVRVETIMGANSATSSYSISVFFWRLYRILSNNILEYIVSYISYLCLIILYVKNNKVYNKDILFMSLLFFVSANISILVMVASPAFPDTVWTGILTYFFLAFGILFANIKFHIYVKRIVVVLALICTVGFLISYKNRYADVCLFSEKLNSRIKYINSEKEKGNRNIKIREQIDIDGVFSRYLDVTESPGNWQNWCYVDYFDIDSIVYVDR